MATDTYVIKRTADYAILMAEARTEYLVWERSQNFPDSDVTDELQPHYCGCGTEIFKAGKCMPCRLAEREKKYPPCACGNPYFSRNMCKTCYYRNYSKMRAMKR